MYFPVRRSSAMMSRIKSDGLSVSVVIGPSKLSAKAQIDNFRDCEQSGERKPLACWFRRRAETNFSLNRVALRRGRSLKSSRTRDGFTSTRDACAPRIRDPAASAVSSISPTRRTWKLLIVTRWQISRNGLKSHAMSIRRFVSVFSGILLRTHFRRRCKARRCARSKSTRNTRGFIFAQMNCGQH